MDHHPYHLGDLTSPLAVFLMSALGKDFWINLILTVLFWVPGVVHAIYPILTRSEGKT